MTLRPFSIHITGLVLVALSACASTPAAPTPTPEPGPARTATQAPKPVASASAHPVGTPPDEKKPARFAIALGDERVARVPVDVIKKYIGTSAPGGEPEDKKQIELPGDRVALIPIEVLEGFVDPDAKVGHGADRSPKGGGPPGGARQESIGGPSAEGLAVGGLFFHSDYELGECDWQDESGNWLRIEAWHRHPMGTEYTEIYIE